MLKKSVVLKAIRREMEAGNIISIAIRRSGVRKQTIANWRKRPMVNKYIESLKHMCDAYRLVLVEDALFKAGIKGNVKAQIYFLKKRDPERWGDKQPIKQGNQNVIVNVTPNRTTIFRDIIFADVDNQKSLSMDQKDNAAEAR